LAKFPARTRQTNGAIRYLDAEDEKGGKFWGIGDQSGGGKLKGAVLLEGERQEMTSAVAEIEPLRLVGVKRANPFRKERKPFNGRSSTVDGKKRAIPSQGEQIQLGAPQGMVY